MNKRAVSIKRILLNRKSWKQWKKEQTNYLLASVQSNTNFWLQKHTVCIELSVLFYAEFSSGLPSLPLTKYNRLNYCETQITIPYMVVHLCESSYVGPIGLVSGNTCGRYHIYGWKCFYLCYVYDSCERAKLLPAIK